jgi:hypothetical protein
LRFRASHLKVAVAQGAVDGAGHPDPGAAAAVPEATRGGVMGYDDRREIFERLEALERMIRDGRGRRGHDRDGDRGRDGGREHGRDRDGRDRGGRHHHHHDHCHHDDRHDDRRGRGGSDFEEKRIIDTIVTLVSEQMMRMLDDRQARAQARNGGDDHGDEKRIVDLIVGLVSEHVQEIVSEELDRRLGRGPLAGERPPHDSGPDESSQS